MNKVECHSGYTYTERPVAVVWEGCRQEIVAIEAEWRSPEGRGFRVVTSLGQRFVLQYHEAQDEWRILPDGIQTG
jgi:hypothetical protein